MTKDQILALPGPAVDELLCEQALRWIRVAGTSVGENGSVSTEGGWLQETSRSTVTRGDGTQASVPQYRVRASAETPSFLEDAWLSELVAHMARGGKALALQWASGLYSARFGIAPAIDLPDHADAIRRAALLAVQP